jgi:hypothetical protein
MCKIGSFVIVVGLFLATTGIGVWAASRTTHQANVNVEDTRHAIPVGRLLVMPLVY